MEQLSAESLVENMDVSVVMDFSPYEKCIVKLKQLESTHTPIAKLKVPDLPTSGHRLLRREDLIVHLLVLPPERPANKSLNRRRRPNPINLLIYPGVQPRLQCLHPPTHNLEFREQIIA